MLVKARQPRRRGFTFVELMVGIIVTSVVILALAVFVYGVGQNWQDSDSAQSAFLAASAGVDRLNHLIRTSQRVDTSPTHGSLDNSTAPAACMLWSDLNGDGLIQYDEVTLVTFDQTNQLLATYTIPVTASNALSQTASLPSAATFAALPNVTKTPLVHDVTACQIYTISPGSTSPRPSVEVILQMATGSGSSQTLVYTTATVRAPG